MPRADTRRCQFLQHAQECHRDRVHRFHGLRRRAGPEGRRVFRLPQQSPGRIGKDRLGRGEAPAAHTGPRPQAIRQRFQRLPALLRPPAGGAADESVRCLRTRRIPGNAAGGRIRGESPLPEYSDQRHLFFPRSRGLANAFRASDPGIDRKQGRRRRCARLGARLRHRRRDLLPRHPAQRGDGADGETTDPENLRDRHRRARPPNRPRRHLPGGHRRGRGRTLLEKIFRAGGRRPLRHRPVAAGKGDLCPAEHLLGSALFPDGHGQLPEPVDLPGHLHAEAGHPAPAFRAEERGNRVAGGLGKHRKSRTKFRHGSPRTPHFQTGRIQSDAGRQRERSHPRRPRLRRPRIRGTRPHRESNAGGNLPGPDHGSLLGGQRHRGSAHVHALPRREDRTLPASTRGPAHQRPQPDGRHLARAQAAATRQAGAGGGNRKIFRRHSGRRRRRADPDHAQTHPP